MIKIDEVIELLEKGNVNRAIEKLIELRKEITMTESQLIFYEEKYEESFE